MLAPLADGQADVTSDACVNVDLGQQVLERAPAAA